MLDCVARTHVGCRRTLNEDDLLARPEQGLFVVADGMGGHEAGEVASAAIIAAMAELPPSARGELLVTQAEKALQQVHDRLRRLAQSGPQPRTIGSTVVGLVLDEQRFATFWAGDSRCYRLRRGQLRQLTRDHSLVQDLVDAGMIGPGEAAHHPNANIVTRAVGATARLEIDSVSGELQPGDRFLLASDGLTRHVDDAELEAMLDGPPLAEVAGSLLDLVLARGAHDNVSFILVEAG